MFEANLLLRCKIIPLTLVSEHCSDKCSQIWMCRVPILRTSVGGLGGISSPRTGLKRFFIFIPYGVYTQKRSMKPTQCPRHNETNLMRAQGGVGCVYAGVACLNLVSSFYSVSFIAVKFFEMTPKTT